MPEPSADIDDVKEPEPSALDGFWVWSTRGLFPHPVFAGIISAACLVVAIIFLGVALSERMWGFGVGSVFFFIAACVVAVTGIFRRRSKIIAISSRRSSFTLFKPTFAVMVLLIGVYTTLLTIAIHVFDLFFKNGPGSTKYYINLGLAIASTLFMHFYGKRIIREHYGGLGGGRNLMLTKAQCVYVVIFVVSVGIYGVWLLE